MSQFTSLEWIQIIVAVGGVIGLVMTAIERIMTMKIAVLTRQLDANTALTAAVKQSVDGTASRAEEQIKGLQTEIRLMRETALEKTVVADKLAAAAAAMLPSSYPATG